MSLSASMSNALSGLTANGRAAGVVSDNLAGALTEGFARREVDLASRPGGGVRVEGVRRIADPVLISERRTAEAATAAADLRRGALSRLEDAIGLPGETGSLPSRVTEAEAALARAAASPSSDAALNGAAQALADLAGAVRAASSTVTALRDEAEAGIARDVAALDGGLQRLAKIDERIGVLTARGVDAHALADERAVLIDALSKVVPMEVVPRPYGRVALVGEGGAILFDGRAARIGFEPGRPVMPGADVAAGTLARVTLDSREVDPPGGGPLSGGTLGAGLALRDDVLRQAQAALDDFAAELIARLGHGGPDGTIAPGASGLFTDAGAALGAAPHAPGLAGRLELNAGVDPGQGGASWRLRDGLGAAAAGPPGEARLLIGLGAALAAPRAAPGGAALDVAARAGALASDAATARLRAEADRAFAVAGAETLRAEERAGGVDTDAELQRLMLIERSFAANARVLSAIDEMMQMITRI